MKPNSFRTLLATGLLCLSITGMPACARTASQTNNQAEDFLPPTMMPSITPLPPTEAPKPTKPVDCTDLLEYQEDITIPDGTEVDPGQKLDKRWQVRNTGTCDWDGTYTLKLIAGDGMSGPEDQALYPARAGSTAVIRVELKAPQEPGTYRSAWQAYNGKDVAFGDPIYIEIKVKEK